MAATLAAELGLAATRETGFSPGVEYLEDRETFAASGDEWNGLVEASDPQPFYRHEYTSAFLASFLKEAPLRVVTARDRSRRLMGGLPLVAGRGSICGIPVRELASPTNVHSLRFDLIVERGGDEVEEQVAKAVFRHLASDPTWDVLRITDVPAGGKAWRIHAAAGEAGFPVGAWESQRSPYIHLPATQAELMNTLSAKFRANLRRRRKRLAETGAITVERLAGDSLSFDDFEQALVMESGGWKGRQGSAANQSREVHDFHRLLFDHPTHRARLSLHWLKISGQPIAFHYGIEANRVFSLVMTSFDERFASFSPGHLLTEEVIKDCVSRGLREFDFLGCDLPWKLEWTGTTRPHHWLFIFRDTPGGRLLRRIKFGWAKAARQLLTKWSMQLSACRASLRRSP